jgi:hypothetical protein
MLSDQQHIDDFFRKKEEAYQPDAGQLDGDWEQLKALMKQGPKPAPKNYRLQTTRRIIKYLGGFTVITVITIVWLTASRTAKKPAVAAKPATQKTVVSKPVPSATKTEASVAATAPKTAVAKPATAIAAKSNATSNKNKPATPQPTKHRQRYDQPVHTPPTGNIVDVRNETATQTTAAVREHRILEEAPKSKDAAQQLAAFYKAIQKPVQEFTINASRDTVLIGKEGTRLTIPALAFATPKRGTVNGNVQIVLREYYSYDDILAAKLTTTFGDVQLKSGGMVNITAEVNGEKAGLKNGKNIKLEMPTKAYDEEMQLFSGMKTSIKQAFEAKFMDNRMIDTVHFLKRQMDDNGTIDWIPEGQSQRLPMRETRKINVFQLYNEPYKVTTGKITTGYFYMSAQCPYPKTEMIKLLKEKSDTYLDKVKIKQLKGKRHEGRLSRSGPVPVVGDSVRMYFTQAIKLKLLSPQDSLRLTAEFRKDSIAEDTRLKLMNRYTFTLSNLGWFNCDRFANDRGPKVLFTYKPEEGFDGAAMVSNLVFTRYRSVLPGNYKDDQIVFGSIPKDEPVKLVCIGVKNGRIMACIQSLAAGQEVGALAFEETTPEQFKKKLQTLNISLP